MTALRAVVGFPGDGLVREVGPDGVHEQGVRTAKGYDELLARLGGLLGVRASVFDGAGLPEPGRGTIVLCRNDGLHRLQVHGNGPLHAVVLLDARRTRALREVESLGLAAALETDPFADWATGRPSAEPSLFGRLDVAAALGGRLDDEPLTRGERAGRFSIPGVTDVPGLLAAYLRAYTSG